MFNLMKNLFQKKQHDRETHVIRSGTKIRFGLPAVVPNDLISAVGIIIEQCDSLHDIYFGLQAIEGELSYIFVVDVLPGYPLRLESIGQKISVVLSEVNPDRSVDLVVATDFYRQGFKEGSLLSCRIKRGPPDSRGE